MPSGRSSASALTAPLARGAGSDSEFGVVDGRGAGPWAGRFLRRVAGFSGLVAGHCAASRKCHRVGARYGQVARGHFLRSPLVVVGPRQGEKSQGSRPEQDATSLAADRIRSAACSSLHFTRPDPHTRSARNVQGRGVASARRLTRRGFAFAGTAARGASSAALEPMTLILIPPSCCPLTRRGK